MRAQKKKPGRRVRPPSGQLPEFVVQNVRRIKETWKEKSNSPTTIHSTLLSSTSLFLRMQGLQLSSLVSGEMYKCRSKINRVYTERRHDSFSRFSFKHGSTVNRNYFEWKTTGVDSSLFVKRNILTTSTLGRGNLTEALLFRKNIINIQAGLPCTHGFRLEEVARPQEFRRVSHTRAWHSNPGHTANFRRNYTGQMWKGGRGEKVSFFFCAKRSSLLLPGF